MSEVLHASTWTSSPSHRGRVGTVHFAELDLRGRTGRSVHSGRPTDALILALHQPVQVPILVDAWLFDEEGTSLRRAGG